MWRFSWFSWGKGGRSVLGRLCTSTGGKGGWAHQRLRRVRMHGQHQHRSPSHVQNRTTPASLTVSRPKSQSNISYCWSARARLPPDQLRNQNQRDTPPPNRQNMCPFTNQSSNGQSENTLSLGILFPKCMTFKPPYFQDHIECLVKGMPVRGYDLEKR